jgi:hypothetical protein
MLFFFLTLMARASGPLPCGTPAMRTDFLERGRPAVAPPSPDLIDQESHGEVAHVQYSEHFALKWGPDFSPSEAATSRLLADFEYSHATEVIAWEMSDPTGAGGTYFNVYVGDTGGVVPSANGNAGYYTLDASGYPMIVLNRELISDDNYIRSVVAHEFFHAVQHAEEAFYYEDTGSWYWEATACWAAGRSVPESDAFSGFLAWYALQPAAGLYHHSFTDHDGAPPDLHQYGAFIFPWYISEVLLAPEAVLASWRLGTPEDDPIATLETILTEEVVARAIADHAAHNLLWDYALGAHFQGSVEGWAGHFSGHDLRYASLIPHPEADFFGVDPAHHPRAGGYALVHLPEDAVTPAGRLTVLLAYDVDATSPPQPDHVDLRATLIEITESGPHYYPVRSDIPHTNYWVAEGADLWLSVANTGLLSESYYPAPFKLSFVPLPDALEPSDTGTPEMPEDSGDPAPTDTGEPDSGIIDGKDDPYVVPEATDTTEKAGCGCFASSPMAPAGILLLIPLLAYRRGDSPRA